MSEQKLIDQRFRIGEKIGCGNFGEVWLAIDEKTKTNVAVKIENPRSNNEQLFLEYRYYTLIHKEKRMPGFPFCYYFGPYNTSSALVLELLGPSLEDLFELCRHNFSPLTVFEIARQTLRLIEVLHSKHIIHRDIKPENFLLGSSKKTMDIIYIIDLGLAKEYVDPITKLHIPYREKKNLTGTARYMSINTHLGKEQSRRDDIEALCHMYFYLLRGTLPWQGLKTENNRERYQKICERKISTTIEILCKGYPDEFASMLRYARQLNFDQTPKYDYLIQLIDTYMRRTNNVNHKPMFDWKPITDKRFIMNDRRKSSHSNERNVEKLAPHLNIQHKKLGIMSDHKKMASTLVVNSNVSVNQTGTNACIQPEISDENPPRIVPIEKSISAPKKSKKNRRTCRCL